MTFTQAAKKYLELIRKKEQIERNLEKLQKVLKKFPERTYETDKYRLVVRTEIVAIRDKKFLQAKGIDVEQFMTTKRVLDTKKLKEAGLVMERTTVRVERKKEGEVITIPEITKSK